MIGRIASGLIGRFVDVWKGRNLAWHAVAIGLTAVLVLSGFDWWFYESTRGEYLYPLVWMAGIGGFFIPVLIPVGLYAFAELRKDHELLLTAIRIVQAILTAFAVAFIYKALTGRVQPEFMNTIGNTDISRGFQFGFFRHGIFWGWPSSHTAVAVAGGVTLFRLVKNYPVRLLTVLYMLIVACGAAVGFHWFSDVVAGAIFGVLVSFIVVRVSKVVYLNNDRQ